MGAKQPYLTSDDWEKALIQFAQLHVKAALEAAWDSREFIDGCDTHGVDLKKESIISKFA